MRTSSESPWIPPSRSWSSCGVSGGLGCFVLICQSGTDMCSTCTGSSSMNSSRGLGVEFKNCRRASEASCSLCSARGHSFPDSRISLGVEVRVLGGMLRGLACVIGVLGCSWSWCWCCCFCCFCCLCLPGLSERCGPDVLLRLVGGWLVKVVFWVSVCVVESVVSVGEVVFAGVCWGASDRFVAGVWSESRLVGCPPNTSGRLCSRF